MADYTHTFPRPSTRWDTCSRASIFVPYDSMSTANKFTRSAFQTFLDYCQLTKLFCVFAAFAITTMILAKFSEVGASSFWMSFSVIGTLLLPVGAVNAVNNLNISTLLFFSVVLFYVQQNFLCIVFFLFLFGGPFLAWSNLPLVLGSVLSLMSVYQGWLTIQETKRIRAGGKLQMPPKKFNKVFSPRCFFSQ